MRLANPCLNGVYLMTPSSGILSASLGFPRIGRNRELKLALEDFWSGATGQLW
ncbi:MAG: hypothetical protein J0H61_10695 [Alphaproteobacteria bacterium]|nr:hypothetical protein [Alphaproteobacteria bacterium]